jgi:hypothetical protein
MAIAAVAALGVPAAAEPWTLALDGACTDADSFRARAEAQRVAAVEATDLAIRVAFTQPAPERWHVAIELTGTATALGTRELDGATCPALADAASLIVAQLLDGALAARRAAVHPTPRPSEMAPIPETTAPPPRAQSPVTLGLGAAFGGELGSLPHATAGGRLALEAGYRRAILSLGVARWMEATKLDERAQGLSVYAWQAFAQARVRVVPAIELGLQIEIGELPARGRGVDTELANEAAWQAIGGVARAALWTRGRLAIVLDAEIVAPLGSPVFVVDGEERFRPGVTFRGLVELRWRLFDGTTRVRP